ncbi:MAG: nuclear transport factor 2 family protein [Actinomycetota bacterium]|nr:nuclear transport factor 2 family protein [Actinomycetota bacterium]
MPETNVETFKRIVAAFNEGGMDAALEYFAEDVEFYDPDLLGGEPIRGREALSQALAPMLDSWESIAVKDFEFVPTGDRVVAMVHVRGLGVGRLGEMEVEMRDAHIMTFREGKVSYWRLYLDRREALADAGLAPDVAGENPSWRRRQP